MITTFAELESQENKIADVRFKQLITHSDSRGFFRELIRFNDPVFEHALGQNSFAQWSHSKMAKHTVKAWHYHHVQYDWWYLGIGVAQIVLFDLREESPTFKKKLEFKLGDPEEDKEALAAIVRIPPGVAHSCKVLTPFAHLFYITSETYNSGDEGRYPFNTNLIGQNWGDEADLIVAANDRREIEPTFPRVIKASK